MMPGSWGLGTTERHAERARRAGWKGARLGARSAELGARGVSKKLLFILKRERFQELLYVLVRDMVGQGPNEKI